MVILLTKINLIRLCIFIALFASSSLVQANEFSLTHTPASKHDSPVLKISTAEDKVGIIQYQGGNWKVVEGLFPDGWYNLIEDDRYVSRRYANKGEFLSLSQLFRVRNGNKLGMVYFELGLKMIGPSISYGEDGSLMSIRTNKHRDRAYEFESVTFHDNVIPKYISVKNENGKEYGYTFSETGQVVYYLDLDKKYSLTFYEDGKLKKIVYSIDEDIMPTGEYMKFYRSGQVSEKGRYNKAGELVSKTTFPDK